MPIPRPTTRARSGRRPARRAPHPADLKPNGKRKSVIWRWRRGFFLVGLLLVAALAGVGYVLSSIDLPPERVQAQTSFICAADVTSNCTAANALASLHGDQDRENVRLDQVPQVMIDAVLAAEDREFFQHGGVDPFGTVRALWADVRNQGSTQGGSTITQQYVKNVYLSSERTFTRKLKEAVLSIKLEQELTKQEILERYLNTVYFGRGAYGVGAASRTYFGHDLSQITLPEAAYLAGLIRSPETADAANPAQVPEATFRRHTVLQAMLETKKITPDQFAVADAVPFVVGQTIQPRVVSQGIDVLKGTDIGTQYFVDYIKQQLNQHGFSDAEIFGGGLRVYTSLDLGAQQSAWDAVTSTLSPDDPSAALVSLDPDNRVKAMIGGRDYATDKNNLAAPGLGGSGRQPGSSFKPYVLSEAILQGISIKSQFNAPSQIVIPKADNGHDWKVNNAEPSSGILDLVDATRLSSNTVYAQLMDKVKPGNVVPLAKEMGITTDLPTVDSLVLGAGEVFPLDQASGYSTWAHRGVHIQPTAIIRVERGDGTVVPFDQPRKQIMSAEQSDLVTYCLQQVIKGGTGTGAAIGKPAAGKTGTTDENKDAWFVGYTPNGYTTAVWMGYEIPEPMRSVHGRVVFGGTFPATIWQKYMHAITDGMDVGSFHDPTSFPGKVLNQDLTTTTAPASTGTSETASTEPSTTAPSSTTSTTHQKTTTSTSEPSTTPTTPHGAGGGP